MVLLIWAFVDLVQVPLIAAVLLAWRLSPVLGAAWKSTAVAFGGYAAWVIITARIVPFAPSGFLLIVMGMALDPRRGVTPGHAWALGSAASLVLFWIVPVAVVRAFGRKAARHSSTR